MKYVEQYLKVKQAMIDFEEFTKYEILRILSENEVESLEFKSEVLPTMVRHYARHHAVVVELTGVEAWEDHVEVAYKHRDYCSYCPLSALDTGEQYRLLQTVANSFKNK